MIDVGSNHLCTYLERYDTTVVFYMLFSLNCLLHDRCIHEQQVWFSGTRDMECYGACATVRETFCACVVLSQLFFLVLTLPAMWGMQRKCKSQGHNDYSTTSHAALFFSCHFFPLPSLSHGDPARFFISMSTIRKQDFLFSLCCWTMTIQNTFRQVGLLMYVFCDWLLGDCHVYLKPAPCFS